MVRKSSSKLCLMLAFALFGFAAVPEEAGAGMSTCALYGVCSTAFGSCSNFPGCSCYFHICL